jgi:hypothetical protein
MILFIAQKTTWLQEAQFDALLISLRRASPQTLAGVRPSRQRRTVAFPSKLPVVLKRGRHRAPTAQRVNAAPLGGDAISVDSAIFCGPERIVG